MVFPLHLLQAYPSLIIQKAQAHARQLAQKVQGGLGIAAHLLVVPLHGGLALGGAA